MMNNVTSVGWCVRCRKTHAWKGIENHCGAEQKRTDWGVVWFWALYFVAFLTLTIALSSCPAEAATVPLTPITNHDGDTFKGTVELRPGLREDVTVRLDCYSAPELRADGGGVAETKVLRDFLSADAGYTLRTEWKHEKYGRLLGEPYRGDAGFCMDGGR